jgi:anti-sigma regulatory factor (Ser/Thr protein kinase)
MRPVVVVEEADADRRALQFQVQRLGYPCLCLTAEAIEISAPECCLILIGAIGTATAPAEFLALLRERYPQVPCVVLTGDSPCISSDVALRAEVRGILPRTDVESDLGRTLLALLGPSQPLVASNGHAYDRHTLAYTMENNPDLVQLVVTLSRQQLEKWPFVDTIDLVRVTVALSEALDNALYHGNLGLSSELRQGTGQAWREESQMRRQISPYRERRIRFQAVFDSDGAEFTVRDDGVGFNPAHQRDCTHAQNLERCSGRGLLLMKMYMDDIQYNDAGNEIVLKKRRPSESTIAQ